jgi:hypothetical protein
LNGKVAAPGRENRDYGRGDPLRGPRGTLYQLKLVLTSPTGCSRSVGIVRMPTKTTEFSFFRSFGTEAQEYGSLNVVGPQLRDRTESLSLYRASLSVTEKTCYEELPQTI